MTYQQGVRIVCRAISVYFLFWVVNDLISLPREATTVWYYWKEVSISGSATQARIDTLSVHLLRTYGLTLTETVLKTALWALGASYFYRCRPGALRFLRADDAESDDLIA